MSAKSPRQISPAQPAKVASFAGGNEAHVGKIAAGDFANEQETRFRLRAFGLHLLCSVCALAPILGGLYLGWYRWPGWYLTQALRVAAIAALLDVGLGPTLTLIVASPGKPRRVLARDVAVIVTVQVAALIYGAVTLWHGRPLYYTFSSDRLEIVQASDLKPAEIALARRQNAALAP